MRTSLGFIASSTLSALALIGHIGCSGDSAADPSDVPVDASVDDADMSGDGVEDMGEESTDASTDASASVTFTFPLTSGVVPRETDSSGATTLTLRGKSDASAELASLTINGEPVVSSDGYATWSIQVQLLPGANTFEVAAVNALGETLADAPALTLHYRDVLKRGGTWVPTSDGEAALHSVRLSFRSVEGGAEFLPIEFHRQDFATGNTRDVSAFVDGLTLGGLYESDGTLYIASYRGGVQSLDLDSGRLEQLSDVDLVRDIQLDLDTNRLFVSSQTVGGDSVFAVDVNSRESTLISGSERGEGSVSIRHFSRGLTYDSTRNVLYLLQNLNVLAIDVATGDRRVLSSEDVGVGFWEDDPWGPVYVASRDRIYSRMGDRVVEYHPETGDRRIVGVLPDGVSTLGDLVFDEATGSLTMSARSHGYLMSMDVDTGSVTMLGGATFPNDGTVAALPVSSHHDVEGRALLFTDDLGRLWRHDLVTGRRFLVGEANTKFNGLKRGLVASDSTAYVLNQYEHQILAYDLITGTSRILTSPSSPGDQSLDVPHVLVLSEDESRVHVLQRDDGALFDVDTRTGVVSSLSPNPADEALPTHLGLSLGMVRDAVSNRLVAVGTGEDETDVRVVAIDASTGERSALAIDVPDEPLTAISIGESKGGARAILMMQSLDRRLRLFEIDWSDESVTEIDAPPVFDRGFFQPTIVSDGFGNPLLYEEYTHGLFQLDTESGAVVMLLQ